MPEPSSEGRYAPLPNHPNHVGRAGGRRKTVINGLKAYGELEGHNTRDPTKGAPGVGGAGREEQGKGRR